MDWSEEAREFLESRREKLPGDAAEIDLALDRIRKDSEKAAAQAGASLVEKDHVRQAIKGLPKIEIVTEATEGAFAFVRALVILGAIMLFVGIVIEAWYQNLSKYGEEPESDVDVFILRYMLWVGVVLLAASGVLYWHGRRQSGQEWEEEEYQEGEAEPAPGEEAGPEEKVE